MKQNNKTFNNAMHKFVGVLDKYVPPPLYTKQLLKILYLLLQIHVQKKISFLSKYTEFIGSEHDYSKPFRFTKNYCCLRF